MLVGIERGFITRAEGMQQFNKIIHFLETADRFHGAWPHWWNGETGKVKPFGRKDDGGDLVEGRQGNAMSRQRELGKMVGDLLGG